VTRREPDFRELVGGDLGADEAARLERVHRLLLEAGPPADLPPQLAEPPGERRAKVIALPPRRVAARLVLAAALIGAAFGGGYLAGHRNGAETWGQPIAMRGAGERLASIRLGTVDRGGNWPLILRVRGLGPLPARGYYELYLAEDGKLGPSCGTFRVHPGITEVRMNAPYRLDRWDEWVIVKHVPGQRESAPLLTT
jgi:hypothetical protein